MSKALKEFETDNVGYNDGNGKAEIRSEEVQDILSAIPHWIVRWGIMTVFSAVIMFLLAAWIVKFPDVITSRVTVTTQTPPAGVMAQTSGYLLKIFVNENDFVQAKTVLAAIENTAVLEDIFQLQKQLQAIGTNLTNSDTLLQFELNEHLRLGELQLDHSNFIRNIRNLKFFRETNYHYSKIRSIKSQIHSLGSLTGKLVNQQEILQKEAAIAYRKFEKNKMLFKKGLISEIDLSNNESIYLQKKFAIESAKTWLINNDIQLSEYEKIVLDLNYDTNRRQEEINLALQESFKKLQSSFVAWEQKYLLKAPITGQVSFFKFWADNQFVNIGDEVMTIVSDAGGIIGKVYLPGLGFGKVEVGQKANIKFDNYPFNEFGAVVGVIESISLVAHDNQYLINIGLPNGFLTTYNKTLDFKPKMQGTVEIITEDLRLFERIFNQLKYILISAR